MAKGKSSKKNNGAILGFEAKLWSMADKLRGHMDAAEYKHVVLGLIFLKYISDAFECQRSKIIEAGVYNPEDRDCYTMENVFWVPKNARRSYLNSRAKLPFFGKDFLTESGFVRKTGDIFIDLGN